jgi:hypothetical protein
MAAVAGVGLAALGPGARAAELPAFPRGLWEFTRAVEGATPQPTVISKKECTSPTETMRRQNELLTKAGCRFTPLGHAGPTYTFSATCPVPGGGSGTSTSVLTVQGDGAYTVKVTSETTAGGRTVKTQEALVAKRVGDCP